MLTMKQVQFSERSVLGIYPNDTSHVGYFTRSEKKSNELESLKEAVRIRKKLLPAGDKSKRNGSLEDCLKMCGVCGVSPEELRGLEQTIFDSPR